MGHGSNDEAKNHKNLYNLESAEAIKRREKQAELEGSGQGRGMSRTN
jgi:hypothetical protein